jgi:hypothetical protein
MRRGLALRLAERDVGEVTCVRVRGESGIGASAVRQLEKTVGGAARARGASRSCDEQAEADHQQQDGSESDGRPAGPRRRWHH